MDDDTGKKRPAPSNASTSGSFMDSLESGNNNKRSENHTERRVIAMCLIWTMQFKSALQEPFLAQMRKIWPPVKASLSVEMRGGRKKTKFTSVSEDSGACRCLWKATLVETEDDESS